MKKVRMIVEMDEELYKAFAEQDVFISGMRTGKTLLSEVWKAIKNATPLTESDDAVSRQAVHDWIKENTEYDEDHCDYFFVMRSSVMHKDIDELTSVTPKRGQIEWFLVSEGLPKVDGSYRVVQKNGSIGTYVFHKDGNSEEYWKRCAVAWMPLSESFEIESED